MLISELLDRMPKATKSPGNIDYNKDFCDKYKIQVNKPFESFFFQPTITIAEPDKNKPVYCLVSAPAGVGKTTVAQYIMSQLAIDNRYVFLVPLNQFKIGTGFFTGLLGDIFPNMTPENVRELVRKGNIIILFDGYDEVTMSESTINDNIVHFIEAMNHNLYPEGNHLRALGFSIFFFFRTYIRMYGLFDPIENISLNVSIDYFHDADIPEYLKKYVEFLYKQYGKEIPATAIKIVDNLWHSVIKAFSLSKEYFEAFFGHALVLNAFGDHIFEELLHNPNLLKLEMSFKNVAF